MSLFKGNLQAFNQDEETFQSWLDQLNIFLRLNKVIDDEEKTDILLSYVGKTSFNVLRDICAPDDPVSKTFDDLKTALKNHFQPEVNLNLRRFRFYKCFQLKGEAISTFIARLKGLANECEFKTFLKEALLSQMIIGVSSEATQKRLLSEKSVNFQKAVEIASCLESAISESKEMHQGHLTASKFAHEANVGLISKDKPRPSPRKACFRCGKTNHSPNFCYKKDTECSYCHKIGHTFSVCLNKKKAQNNDSNSSSKNGNNQKAQRNSDFFKNKAATQLNSEYIQTEEDDVTLLQLNILSSSKPIMVTPLLNGIPIEMELDTGAAVSVISHEDFSKLPNVSIQDAKIKLTSYTGDPIPVHGKAIVSVKYNSYEGNLPIIITKSHRHPLFGRDWLQNIPLDWPNLKIQNVATRLSSENIVNEFPELFSDSLGKYNGNKVKIKLKADAQPIFMKARSVPYALKTKVEEHLDKLVNDGVLEPISSSEWATPVVVVPKKDNDIRLCGDFKVTINPYLEVDSYPLPKPADLFSTLNGGVIFSKIDLSRAYEQLELDDDSKNLLVLNTHKGLFRYTRLAYGITSAPAIFQSFMEKLLNGISNVGIYLDDILITGPSVQSHDSTLRLVLTKLQSVGLRVKMQKTEIAKESVLYLGHVIDKFGKHASPTKINAVKDAPIPKNITELTSFLGLVKYYGEYIKNLSTIANPLYKLTCKNEKFIWSKTCDDAFTKLKQYLISAPVLAHYDVNLPIRLACDASSYGISAVISHVYKNGLERPIAYASRTLSSSERGYAQIDKEALSLVYGVKIFHQYLYGRHFTLVSDHKPLLAILGEKKGLPTLAAARLQRYAIILSAYRYDIIFKPSKSHGNADALSRLPVPSVRPNYIDHASIFYMQQIEILPITAKEIKIATKIDPILSKVLEFTITKWPNVVDSDLELYKAKQVEIAVEDNVLMWGRRVIIPKKYQKSILNELHSSHQGIVKTKSLARLHVWWPNIDSDIERLIANCSSCQFIRNKPSSAPLHPWEWPKAPWQRIHIDFAGPFLNTNFLIVIDAHSKWIEVEIMNSTTAQKTVAVLQKMFASYGIPENVVSDNGPQFTSEEFKSFMSRNGIKHITSSPYQPSTNGEAEKAVQIIKKALKKVSFGDLQSKLNHFLLQYRTTPHVTTGVTPSELFMNRRVKTRLDLLKPDYSKVVLDKQCLQKHYHDNKSLVRTFVPGQNVMVLDNRLNQNKWTTGKIIEQIAPLTYHILVGNEIWKRHVDHIILCKSQVQTNSENESNDDFINFPSDQNDDSNDQDGNVVTPPVIPPVSQRYPSRIRKPPDRLNL